MIARVALAAMLAAAPATAQHHHMPGMAMPMPAEPDARPAPKARTQARPAAAAKRGGSRPRTLEAAVRAARPTIVGGRDAASHVGQAMPMDDPPGGDGHAGHAMPMDGATSAGSNGRSGHAVATDGNSDAGAGSVAGQGGHAMHGGHAMPMAGPADAHAGHAMPGGGPATGTALPAGNAPPPPVPHDHFADRLYPAAAMDRARATMMREGGGQRFHQLFLNIAEASVGGGRNGYRWDGEGWYGGDIHRAVIKSEGEGDLGGRTGAAEVQALYSRAIGPYFDLQAGVRHDLRPRPDRTYATIGIEGLAPYWFEVEAALFLSTRGDVLGRIEAWADQRLTQRLVLQPRVEANLAAQDDRATGTGRGLAMAEAALRLRYEIARTFAPYVGVAWEARTGRSARLARAAGEEARSLAAVAGVRFWF